MGAEEARAYGLIDSIGPAPPAAEAPAATRGPRR